MNFSYFLAHAWGIFLFLVCFGLLLNRKTFLDAFEKMTTMSLFIMGFILLIIGSLQIVGYEHWSISWRGLITLLGWATLFKGIAIFFIPDYHHKLLKLVREDNIYTFSLIFGMLLGIYLLTIPYSVGINY